MAKVKYIKKELGKMAKVKYIKNDAVKLIDPTNEAQVAVLVAAGWVAEGEEPKVKTRKKKGE